MRYCFLLSLFAAAATTVLADNVETREGKWFSGTGRFGVDAIEFKTDDATMRLPLADVASFVRDAAVNPKKSATAYTGLMAEYFADLEWKKSCAIALTQAGSFDWGHDAPNPYTPALFSLRMTGSILIPRRGTYRFSGNDLTRIEIDGRPIGKDKEADAKGFTFTEGQRVPVLLEFRKAKGVHGRANIRWESESIDNAPIPPENFVTPDDFVTRLETFHRQQLAESAGGLKGEYFRDKEFKDRVMVRLDPNLSMNWPNSATLHPALVDGFSARWTGRLRANRTGKFKFQIGRGMRLWINGGSVIDASTKDGRGDPPTGGTYDMKEGDFYDLKIEVIRGKGWGDVRLSSSLEADWMPPVNPRFLYPPKDIPRTRIILPLDKEDIDATDGTTIRVAATPGDGQITQVEIIDSKSKTVLGQSTKAPYDVVIRPKEAGAVTLQARVTNNREVASLSASVEVSLDSPAERLAGGHWSLGRVGDSAAPTATVDKDRITVSGGSGSLSDRSNLPLVTQLINGDCDIIARLAELKTANADVIAIGGLTLRRSMWAESAHISAIASPKRGWYVANAYRNSESGSFAEKPFRAPAWFRISRAGPYATAYWSEDGQAWTSLGSMILGEDQPMIAGLTAFSMNDSTSVEAVFDHVSIRLADAARLSDGPGVQLVSGTVIPGVVSVQADQVSVRSGNTNRQFARDQVARVFYGAMPASQVVGLPDGWRGAIVNNDRMEGDPSDITADGATVTSVLFGPQPLTPGGGLAMVALADVRPDPAATIVRFTRGRAMAKEVRLEGGKLICRDAALGDLQLELSEVISIRRPR